MIVFHARVLDATTSTNDEVKRALAAGEAEGLAVRARVQTGGYGRQGRAWTSPEGGLYCSWLVRPEVPSEVLPTLSLVVSMAVRRALVRLAPASADAILIKWPNDVVCKAGKLCGISLETHAGGVCVGTGVNVFSPAERPDVGGKHVPAYLADFAPEFALMPSEEALDRTFQVLARELALLYQVWLRDGFAPLVDEYNKYASLTSHFVCMVDRSGNSLAQGVVARVDAFGRLILRDTSGVEIPVFSGEAHIA